MMGQVNLSHADMAKTTFDAERTCTLEVFKCVVDGVEVLYCSTPITGGWRFLNWYSDRGRLLDQADLSYVDELRSEVIEPNCEAGKAHAGELRRQTPRIVIDPTRFFLNHWTQPDYHELWCEVIRRYASAVHFADGWWLSEGCAMEFATAIEHNIATFEGCESALSVIAGFDLLQQGVRLLDNANAPSNGLLNVAEKVKSFIPREKSC